MARSSKIKCAFFINLKRRKIFLSAFLLAPFVFSSQSVDCQTSGADSLGKQFDNYHKNLLQEKLYVHTDKNFYLAGELAWFKIYNVDAGFHKLVDISKVAYIEVLDREHNPVVQTKTALEGGLGDGSFLLPQSLVSGNYIFRAYTNWMKNFDPDFFFEKIITIVNTIKAEAINTAKNGAGSFDIQFFPEGGNLVNNIESTIGFRVVDQYGHGNNVNGIILNNKNDTIANFKSLKFGIGSFRLQPKPNNIYKAIIDFGNGTRITKELPKAYDEGYVLHIAPVVNGKVSVKIQCSENADKNAYLFIHCRQRIIESKALVISSNQIEFFIDEATLGDGISHFTLLNGSRQPLCERLYFKTPVQQLFINAVADQKTYGPRKKINIQLEAKNVNGNLPTANLSLAVYKVDSLSVDDQNIQTYLSLTSDLKGNIESPNYYFDTKETGRLDAIDNLMITHGWRRFAWEDVLQGNVFRSSYIPEYEGHIVLGIVKNKATSEPEKNIQSFFAIPDSIFQFYTGLSDEKGNVNFYTKNFFGLHEIFAQAGGRNRGYRIDLKSPFFENFSSRNVPAFSLATVSGVSLQAKSVSMQVQNIYAADKLNRFSYSFDTSLFYRPTKSYLLDNYVRFPTMEEVLREYVVEVSVTRQNNALTLFNGRKDAAGIIYRYEPLVLVDGIPLFDNPHKIFEYDPLKIKELHVVNENYFLGPVSSEGILSFRTYIGKPEDLKVDSNATVLDYEGLQLKREFFTPVYETPAQVSSRLPDFRNLLYWNPKIKIEEGGKKEFSFYSSDLPGKYAVVIQGLSHDGKPGSYSFTFDVLNTLFAQK